jgi:hypothetical protein
VRDEVWAVRAAVLAAASVPFLEGGCPGSAADGSGWRCVGSRCTPLDGSTEWSLIFPLGFLAAAAVNAILSKLGLSAPASWNISGNPCSGAATDDTPLDDNPAFNPAIKCECSDQNNTLCHVIRLWVVQFKLILPQPETAHGISVEFVQEDKQAGRGWSDSRRAAEPHSPQKAVCAVCQSSRLFLFTPPIFVLLSLRQGATNLCPNVNKIKTEYSPVLVFQQNHILIIFPSKS